jgi:hypothetical protein
VLRVEPMADGSILLGDTENHRLRRIGADGTIRTIAGTGDAAVLWPYDLALASDGSVLVVEYQTPRIRRVDPASGAVETIVGPR